MSNSQENDRIQLREQNLEERIFTPLSPGEVKTHFDDVGGMERFKEMARMKIVLPFQQPELFRKFKKQAGGGVLLYGPPGCGKTHFARAIAGECGAAFFNVGIDAILDMWLGNSEKNVARLFAAAREHRPAVLFIDELDALGRRRDLLRTSSMAGTVSAFLNQMDGLTADTSDLLVIGATNAVWDVDNAFKRPGRFDRVLFLPPPDQEARREILRIHVEGIPADSLDLDELAYKTEHFSGADLRALVERASDAVLESILKSGAEQTLTMHIMREALADMTPSTLEWLEIAANYVEYANESGLYNELAAYLKTNGKRRRLGFSRS